MTRIYRMKLVLLLVGFLLDAILVAGQQWVGVASQSPARSNISTTGNTRNTAEISVEIPGFYLTDVRFEGKDVKLPQLSDGHPILSTGCPDLQKLNFTLQLPANGDLEINISSSQFIDYTDIDIIPSAGNVKRNELVNVLQKGEQYTVDAFYPGILIDTEKPFVVRNTRAQSYQIYPLQYNPVTKVLRFYYQLTFTLNNIENTGYNSLSASDQNIKPIEGIGAEFINSEIANNKSGTLPSDRGSMLIICPEKFKEAIAPLAQWRIQTGIATEIVNSEQFANVDAIYNFVKSYYTSNPNFAYLLLVGDSKQIPAHSYNYGPSDNYYSYLSGDDHYPDILVGRFSAENVREVEIQVNRTLQYEKDPGTDATWLTNATGIGSTLSPGDDNESDFQHIRKLLKTLKTTTYTSYNEFFDGSQGELDAEGNPSQSDIIAKFNKGTGVIFYAGHGSPTILATGSITSSSIQFLNNNGKYPIIWAAACDAGDFVDKSCLAETWLHSANSNGEPTGAIAAVMSSGPQTSYPPMEAQDKFASLMSAPVETLSTMGAITIKGLMSMNDVYGSAGSATTDTWILFGDPALRVRTDLPKLMLVENKETLGAGRTFYKVKSNSANGVACLSSQGTILGTAILFDGMANISLDRPASGDNMILTITALNYIPYIDTIQIIKYPGNIEAGVPVNHSNLQSINSSFSWESGDGGSPDYYQIYLGTDNPPTNLINGEIVNSTLFKPQFNFEYNTKYFWRVVPVNSYGKAEGKVMDFRTVFAPEEDFEPVFNTRSSWTDGGAKKWESDVSQAFEGTHSVRSGQINDNEYSSLIFPCKVSNCDFVSFWNKTSCDVNDKLQFIVDGTTIDEWSGLSEWSFHIYKIDAGAHQLQWRYSKNGNTKSGMDAVWLDNIHLPVHTPATANVPVNGSVCEASTFETSATASNYFTINWVTDGDGSFDDVNLENPVYSPGNIETANSSALLQMLVHGFDGCPVLTKSLELTINALPVISLPNDTIVTEGSSIQLDASQSGSMNYKWLPSGSNSSTATIDSTGTVNGAKSAVITVTSQKGCSTTKEIIVHFNNSAVADKYTIFPNPNFGTFTLKPVKGSAVIDQMILFNSEGNVVWKGEGSCKIIGSKKVSINGLAKGEYYLVNENKSGKSFNPVVIQ